MKWCWGAWQSSAGMCHGPELPQGGGKHSEADRDQSNTDNL